MASKDSCKPCCCGCGAFSFVMFLIAFCYYILTFSFDETACNITNVVYPTHIPLENETVPGFIECSCGRACTSHLGTCIKIYVTSDNGYSSMARDDAISYYAPGFTNTLCTFYETRCPDGKNLDTRRAALEEAAAVARRYMDMKNNHAKTTCFTNPDDGSIYLHKEVDIVWLSITGGITLLLFMCCACVFCC